MIIEKFSLKVLDAVDRAGRLAVKHGHRNTTEWHLLTALLQQEDTYLKRLLVSAEVDIDVLAHKVDTRLIGLPRAGSTDQTTPISRTLERVFVNAEEHAGSAAERYIRINHLMLGLLDDGDVRTMIDETGGRRHELVRALREARATPDASAQRGTGAGTGTGTAAAGPASANGSAAPQGSSAAPSPATVSAAIEGESLAKYARDLTAAARDGELDPLIGRDAEVQLAVEILCRRRKNNPILIGEPGVGKTAIVEGLAQRIVDGRVPDDLQRCRLMSLDLAAVVAGARYRGEFEERLQRILAEVAEAGNIILLIGAGGQEGSMDAANMLKPALSRGQLRCMGATSTEEYRKRIEKDAALMRRFQVINVPEPSVEESVAMLRGAKEKYETHHGIRLMDEAISAAVKFSRRYVTDRYLPDKAFDLIDQTAASVRLALVGKPEALEQIDRQIVRLEIETHALARESAPRVRERLAVAQAELAALKIESAALTTRWEREKKANTVVHEAKKALEDALREKEAKLAVQDFARVAELQYKVIPECERVLAEFADLNLSSGPLLQTEVSEGHVAATVSRITGIPAASMVESEKERLLQLEAHLRRRVIGQDDALSAVARAVRRARAGVQNPNRPIASFLMLGPTGVGKTELAKALAELLFDDERALVRLDMSEYMEKHSAAMLVGAPPGYVGYEEGGVLTNKIRRRPYSVILFDEVEKGHNDVYNLFLQLLDDGRLTDTQGITVDFTNAIVVMTSNLGSEFMRVCETPQETAEMNQQVMHAVRGKFRPEFLNRLDEVMIFKPLTMEVMKPIVDIQLGKLQARLRERRIELSIDDAARTVLAEAGYNPAYGARPLQRVVQSRLQDPLAQFIVEGAIIDGQSVAVTAAEKELVIEPGPKPVEDGEPAAGHVAAPRSQPPAPGAAAGVARA